MKLIFDHTLDLLIIITADNSATNLELLTNSTIEAIINFNDDLKLLLNDIITFLFLYSTMHFSTTKDEHAYFLMRTNNTISEITARLSVMSLNLQLDEIFAFKTEKDIPSNP